MNNAAGTILFARWSPLRRPVTGCSHWQKLWDGWQCSGWRASYMQSLPENITQHRLTRHGGWGREHWINYRTFRCPTTLRRLEGAVRRCLSSVVTTNATFASLLYASYKKIPSSVTSEVFSVALILEVFRDFRSIKLGILIMSKQQVITIDYNEDLHQYRYEKSVDFSNEQRMCQKLNTPVKPLQHQTVELTRMVFIGQGECVSRHYHLRFLNDSTTTSLRQWSQCYTVHCQM